MTTHDNPSGARGMHCRPVEVDAKQTIACGPHAPTQADLDTVAQFAAYLERRNSAASGCGALLPEVFTDHASAADITVDADNGDLLLIWRFNDTADPDDGGMVSLNEDQARTFLSRACQGAGFTDPDHPRLQLTTTPDPNPAPDIALREDLDRLADALHTAQSATCDLAQIIVSLTTRDDVDDQDRHILNAAIDGARRGLAAIHNALTHRAGLGPATHTEPAQATAPYAAHPYAVERHASNQNLLPPLWAWTCRLPDRTRPETRCREWGWAGSEDDADQKAKAHIRGRHLEGDGR